MKNLLWILIAFILGFVVALSLPHKPVIKTITKTEPGKIIYLSEPTPTPIIVEKVIIKDNKVSFQQDLSYKDKQIQTDSVTMKFDGVYHVQMQDNALSVTDEIVGNVQTTIKYELPKEPHNEIGVLDLFSLYGGNLNNNLGGYYRHSFGRILFTNPSIQFDIVGNQQDGIRVDLRGNIPIYSW